MTDFKQRPDCFDFAMDVLGEPEAGEILAYVEQLEARAALAQPEPEVEPTLREEFTMILNEARCNSARAIGNIELGRRLVAAVERFNRSEPEPEGPTPQPIPVSERLPRPEDCDEKGRCWWFCFECPGEYSYWIFAKEVYCEPPHWLPAHALPVPSSGKG